MWKIKNVLINSHVVLAPMAGITSLGYREFLKPFGIGYSVTEMISDAGIVNHNLKTLNYLKTSNYDRPIAIQLFGNNLLTTLKAIDIINNELHINYDFLDINLGCSVKKIIKNNAGSIWLKNIKKMYNYIKNIVKYSQKPVTVKIRLGFKKNNIRKIVYFLEKAGVSAITIHARTGKQKYSDNVNYEAIKNIGNFVKIPIIISGNIFTLDDAIKALKITKATAIMVARGAIGNPFLITQIKEYFVKKIKLKNSLTLIDNINYCHILIKKMIAEKGEILAIMILKKIIPKFFNNFENAKNIRKKICQDVKTYKDLNFILNEIK